MTKGLITSVAALLLAALSSQARADEFQITFVGPGVSGTVALTYGSTTDAKYPAAFAVTGASGTFTDTNIGIVNANIAGVEPLNLATPEPTNLLAPANFSSYAVASGLGPEANGALHYDNLFWPGGSPQTASDYPFHGGAFDIYGLLLDLGGGKVVNLWSNGVLPDTTSVDYGVAVVTHDLALDYTGGVVAQTPEPGTLCLLGTGLAGMLFRRRSFFS